MPELSDELGDLAGGGCCRCDGGGGGGGGYWGCCCCCCWWWWEWRGWCCGCSAAGWCEAPSSPADEAEALGGVGRRSVGELELLDECGLCADEMTAVCGCTRAMWCSVCCGRNDGDGGVSWKRACSTGRCSTAPGDVTRPPWPLLSMLPELKCGSCCW